MSFDQNKKQMEPKRGEYFDHIKLSMMVTIRWNEEITIVCREDVGRAKSSTSE